MKKLFKLTLCVILATLVFGGCVSSPETTGNNNAANSESGAEIQGIKDNTKYENAMTELGFNLPEGWVFFSEKEISHSLNLPSNPAEAKKTASEGSAAYFCDTAAFSKDFKSAVIVTIEEINEATAGLSPQTLADNAVSAAEKDAKDVYDLFETEKKVFEISGTSVQGYDAKSEFDKNVLYQRSFIIPSKTHITTVTMTSPDSKGLDDIMKCFYKIEK